MKAKFFLTLVGLAALVFTLFAAGPATATHVDPIFVEDNPSCTDLGYDFGFKPQPEPPPSGTYTFPDGVNTVTITSDGTFFDWTSTLGIDAVIVKGGPDANLYVYDPPAEATSDTGLHSPINPSNNQPFGISHIEFCYDYELDVSKTAETSFTRTFEWTIEKTVNPDTWDLFTGDSGTSEYTVTVTKTGFTDSNFQVSGTITIENNTPFAATITDVTDTISGYSGTVTVSCPGGTSQTLPAGETLTCTYASEVEASDVFGDTNTATVTTTGQVGGDSDTADVIFGDPTELVNDSINVEDTHAGDLGTFSDSGSASYERTFTCDDDQGTHENTATIVETGQSDDASVTVNCYALVVTKNARTSFTRTWEWTIDKSADQSALTISPGQTFLVNYEVVVDATSVDSGFALEGDIWIANPNPSRDATLTEVSDIVSPGINAVVDCPSLTVPAGDSLHCTYTASLPDGTNRTNTATATLQNYAFDPPGDPQPSGTTDFNGSADVDFSGATITEIDECVDVSDTYAGTLGTVCAGVDALPKTFQYTREIGPFQSPEDCGEQQVDNTASFVTNDTGATGQDSWTVVVTVPCEFGCTLTPGYWKTHSQEGPAPYDDTWALLGPAQEDTIFFLSGQSYYDVLWTPPGGNAYYILAHQYIAAQLNFLNGADPSDVQAAFNQATTLFQTYTPAQIGALKGNNPTRKQFIALARTLDAYNNGLTGPGHCSEDSRSATGVSLSQGFLVFLPITITH